MAYTDKLRVVYGDLVYMVKDLIIFFLMHKADSNLSLKTDMSGCTAVQSLLSGGH